jgi:hypothetical protein
LQAAVKATTLGCIAERAGVTMRFKSAKTGPYQVLAVSGTNTISFAISAGKAGTKGLLGFAVERSDPAAEQDFYAFGFKVFPSLVPKPDEKTKVKTSRHPVQSFVWDDFTAKPDHPVRVRLPPAQGHAQEARPQRPAGGDPRADRAAVLDLGARHLLQSRRRQQPGLHP